MLKIANHPAGPQRIVWALGLLICQFSLALTVRAQILDNSSSVHPPDKESAWEEAAGNHKEFDVASVKVSPPEAPIRGNEIITPINEGMFSGDLLSANLPLLNYIIFAYKIEDATQYQRVASQLPKWAQTDHFAIEARTTPGSTKDQIRLMMQSLLKERFYFSYHYELKQMPISAFTLERPGKTGSNLTPHSVKDVCTKKEISSPSTTSNGEHIRYCGTQAWPAGEELHIRMIDLPIDQILKYLGIMAVSMGGYEGTPVVDHTGLTGDYDMDFQFAKVSLVADDDANAKSGRTFTYALSSQLGLKLTKQTGVTEEFIVDHISLPSSN